jgi:hypothetical protein
LGNTNIAEVVGFAYRIGFKPIDECSNPPIEVSVVPSFGNGARLGFQSGPGCRRCTMAKRKSLDC